MENGWVMVLGFKGDPHNQMSGLVYRAVACDNYIFLLSHQISIEAANK
jgi:hypothetical protein